MDKPKPKKIVPRGKWVLVLPVARESKETEHGIIIPDTEEREQKAQGMVKAFGEGVVDLKDGDVVVYGVFAGENLKTREGGEEVEYKLLLDEDIIAFVR